MSFDAFELVKVFFNIRRSGIVNNDDLRRMAIPPKMFVIFMDGLSDVSETVGRDYKIYVWIIHNSTSSLCM
jgi:hypothetical protein